MQTGGLFLQQLINGITLGAVYALIALGYTMVYGVLEFINFAHGEIYMMGAYIGFLLIGFLGITASATGHVWIYLPILFILPMIFSAFLGVTVEFIAYRPLRSAPRLAPLISAVGVSIFLQNAAMLWFGSDNKPFPNLIPGSLDLKNIHFSYLQIFIILSSLFLMAILQLMIKKTKLGVAIRATALDQEAAALMGININRIISATFLIGSSLAAAAGIMVGMYYGVVKYDMGYIAGIKAFTCAVLGGIGNIPGAMLGGFLLGILENLGAGYISSQYKDAIAFFVLVLVLIFKPSGLLGARIHERA